MKTKELKKLAKEIFDLEEIIETSSDKNTVNKAKKKILEISGSIGVEDMLRIDEFIQEQIQKQS